MRMVVSSTDDSFVRIAGSDPWVTGHRGVPGFAGAQRDGRVTTLMGHDRAPVACQLGIPVLETAASLPLSLQDGGVLGVAAVGALPGLRHSGLREAGVGPPAQGEP